VREREREREIPTDCAWSTSVYMVKVHVPSMVSSAPLPPPAVPPAPPPVPILPSPPPLPASAFPAGDSFPSLSRCHCGDEVSSLSLCSVTDSRGMRASQRTFDATDLLERRKQLSGVKVHAGADCADPSPENTCIRRSKSWHCV
jgi:hypothetical protein